MSAVRQATSRKAARSGAPGTLQHHKIRPSRRLDRVERILLSAAFDSCREKTEWANIESHWTARRREQAGIFPTVRKRPAA